MMYIDCSSAHPSGRKPAMRSSAAWAAFAMLSLIAQPAMAQDKKPSNPDDLDVTMQIITDPDAKKPDEVVRRILLPARAASSAPAASDKGKSKSDAKEDARSREAKEQSRDAAESAKERARDAAEQREDAKRARAEERRRDRQPPDPPRGHPPR